MSWGNRFGSAYNFGFASPSIKSSSNSMRETTKPQPLAQAALHAIDWTADSGQQTSEPSDGNTTMHIRDENAALSKHEQGMALAKAASSTPCLPPAQQQHTPELLPPHIRMLAPHLRAKEKMRWEASQHEAATAAEEKTRREKQRQDELLMLKGVVTEKQAGHNAAWTSLVAQEKRKTAAAGGTASTPASAAAGPAETKPSAQRWVVDGEDIHHLENGRTVTSARLRLVTDDGPSVCVPPPDPGNAEKFQPLQPLQHASLASPLMGNSAASSSAGGSGTCSESRSGNEGGGAPLIDTQLDTSSPQWESKDQQSTPVLGGVPWSQSQWSDPKAGFTDVNWATQAATPVSNGTVTDVQRKEAQPEEKVLPVVGMAPVEDKV
ncbi:hypothetical protein SCUCBS95973_007414 [Sporothrix curviconia]|uniref:Uncharacterized protein n=1 Tax=Sporothrix curviconia TaxID=1260050 RepID=A0ABP0CFU3_9PEZI